MPVGRELLFRWINCIIFCLLVMIMIYYDRGVRARIHWRCYALLRLFRIHAHAVWTADIRRYLDYQSYRMQFGTRQH